MSKSVAIVTGGSSGIGRSTAIRLARDFESVAIAARDAAGLEETSQRIREAGAEPLALEVDLTSENAAALVTDATIQRFGRIDALVNVAGAVPGLDLFQMTDEQWEEGLALKFHGARRLTIRAWDPLRSFKGAVVFVSGNAAELPKASAAAVGSINAAIEALAKAFAERGISDGIQVNCVSPGAVMTGRRRAMLEKAAAGKGISLEDMKKLFIQQAGISRFGTPEEIADVIAFSVSPAARWMTGTVVRIDGGEVKSL